MKYISIIGEEKAVLELHYSRESAVRDLVRTAPPSLTLPHTPPKCGTTWLRELAWLVTHNADIDKVNTY